MVIKLADVQSDIYNTEKESGLSLRELTGLNKIIKKTRSQLTVNVVKLSEVDNKIKYEQENLNRWKEGSQYTDEMRIKYLND